MPVPVSRTASSTKRPATRCRHEAQVAHHLEDHLLVVDHHHAAREARLLPAALLPLGPELVDRFPGVGQEDAESRALARRRVDHHVPAVLVHDAVHHGQAHAAALADLLGRVEGLEHAVDHARLDARPAVAHRQLDERAGELLAACGAGALTARRPQAERDLALAAHGVARVDAQVEQHLLELHRVGLDRADDGVEVRLELDA